MATEPSLRPSTPLIAQDRTPGHVFDFYDNPRAPHIFVDGVAQMSIGVPMTRMLFHRALAAETIEGVDQPVEIRQLELSLTIPTGALLEILVNLARTVGANPQPLLDALEQQQTALKTLLASVKVT